MYILLVLHNDKRTWNAGSVDGHNEADDVSYFTALMDYLTVKLRGNPRMVFITGMSNGAFMAHRLACAWQGSHINVIAIAPTLGGLAKMKYDTNCLGAYYKIGHIPIPSIKAFDQKRCPYNYWITAPEHFSCSIKNMPILIINNGADVLVPLNGSNILGEKELYPPVEYTLR
jgi:poly(3-hydroxybutyrate) depolymerase